MKILVLNPILFTPEKNVIPEVDSIKDTMIYTMCMGFKEAGHEVTLAAIADYKPRGNEKNDFEILYFKNNGNREMAAVLPFSWSMRNYIRKNKDRFDLIVCSEVFGFHTLFAAMAAPEKTLAWQELSVLQKKFKRLPAKFWHHIIVPLFMKNVLVVPRSTLARAFIRKYMPRVTEEVVEHGMNLDKFVAGLPKKKQFIVVSQLIPRKNIASIIDKFSRFCRKYSMDYKLLICGRGAERENLERQIKELGMENNIEMLGFRSHKEIGVMMAESQAMLIDTFQDANMITIPEAVVAGTPVITNRVPTTDLIDGHGTGIRKDGWNEDDLWEVATHTSYHENCMKMRQRLSNINQAKALVRLFLENPYPKK